MSTVTIQVQLERDGPFSSDDLQYIQGKMNELCHAVERNTYVRCEMFVGNQVYRSE